MLQIPDVVCEIPRRKHPPPEIHSHQCTHPKFNSRKIKSSVFIWNIAPNLCIEYDRNLHKEMIDTLLVVFRQECLVRSMYTRTIDIRWEHNRSREKNMSDTLMLTEKKYATPIFKKRLCPSYGNIPFDAPHLYRQSDITWVIMLLIYCFC